MTTSTFVQSAADKGREEIASIFGAPPMNRVLSVTTPDAGLVAVARRWLRVTLRQLARALYLSPLLIVAKLVLASIDERASDLTIVVLCAIVTAFFVVLNLYIVFALLHWLRLRGFAGNNLAFRPFSPRALTAPQCTKVRGRVERLSAEGSLVVLRDFWARGVLAWRVTEVTVFLVRPEDPSAEPAVVACTTAPDIEGSGEATSAADFFAAASPQTHALAKRTAYTDDEGVLFVLRDGEAIEVTAVRSEPIDTLLRIPLPGGEVVVASPEAEGYRDRRDAGRQAGGILLVDDVNAPLHIRRISGGLAEAAR